MPTVDGSPVGLACVAPAGSVLRGDVYSEPATWRVEPNPAFPAQPNSYRIVRISDGAVFTTDTRYNLPLDNRALADAIRRAGPGQIIELAPGSNLASVSVGNTDVGKLFCAYWGPPQGPFEQIRDLTIRSQVPSQPARVNGMTVSRFVRNNSGQTFNQGPVSMRIEQLELHYQGGLYIWDTPIGEAEVNGLFEFWDVGFFGSNSYGGGFDTKSALRAAYARWDLQRCRFPESNEHSVYVDAPQGSFRMLDCFNTSNAGIGSARNGRTFTQIVSRSQTDTDAAGGPPGFGTVLFERCVATRTGQNGGAAYTIASFLGDVIIRDCSAPDSASGLIVVWSDWGKGLHTTLGTFDYGPWPISGTAFTTRRLRIENFSGNALLPWANPTYPIAISGVELVEIGLFDVQAPRPVFGFWAHAASGYLGGPLDNGEVRFLAPPLGLPVSSHPGFNGGPLADYASPSNPNQGAPYGTGSTGRLTAAGIDALTNVNANYPPWPQPLAGAVYGAPASVTCEAPTGEVLLTAPGLNVFGSVVSSVAAAPAGIVDAPRAIDGAAAVCSSTSPAGTVDAPRTVGGTRVGVMNRAPTGTVTFGVNIDGPATVAVSTAPLGAVSRQIDAQPLVLTSAAPAGSLQFSLQTSAPLSLTAVAPAGQVVLERVVDGPALATLSSAPAGLLTFEFTSIALPVTASAPAGQVTFERTVDGTVSVSMVTAPGGLVLLAIDVAAPPLVVATAAPAGSLQFVVAQASSPSTTSSAPAGTVEAGFIFAGELAVVVATAPAGERLLALNGQPASVSSAAPAGTVDGVPAALVLELNLVAPSAREQRIVQLDTQVASDLVAASRHELRLLYYSAVELELTAATAIELGLLQELEP